MKPTLKYAVPIALAAIGSDEPAIAFDDMWLSLDGIQGESADPGHKDEIDIVSWSWSLSGGPQTAPQLRDLKLIKQSDRASTALAQSLATGKLIGEGVLTVQRQFGQEEPFEYLKMEMKGVSLTQLATGGKEGDEATTETISLTFSELCLTYTVQNPDGSPGGSTNTCITNPGTKQ